MSPVLVLVVAYVAGAIPFSNVAARLTRGVDLREVGSGTVSGTSLFRVAGFVPLALAGVCDVAKGAVGPLLAGSGRPGLAALAGGLAVVGHNWSPFLRGAGGRGISTAMGALAATAWPGSLILLVGLAVGRLIRQTALVSLVAELSLTPLLALLGWSGAALVGLAVTIPMIAKRVIGNAAPRADRPRTYLTRLLFDRDERDEPDGIVAP